MKYNIPKYTNLEEAKASKEALAKFEEDRSLFSFNKPFEVNTSLASLEYFKSNYNKEEVLEALASEVFIASNKKAIEAIASKLALFNLDKENKSIKNYLASSFEASIEEALKAKASEKIKTYFYKPKYVGYFEAKNLLVNQKNFLYGLMNIASKDKANFIKNQILNLICIKLKRSDIEKLRANYLFYKNNLSKEAPSKLTYFRHDSFKFLALALTSLSYDNINTMLFIHYKDLQAFTKITSKEAKASSLNYAKYTKFLAICEKITSKEAIKKTNTSNKFLRHIEASSFNYNIIKDLNKKEKLYYYKRLNSIFSKEEKQYIKSKAKASSELVLIELLEALASKDYLEASSIINNYYASENYLYLLEAKEVLEEALEEASEEASSLEALIEEASSFIAFLEEEKNTLEAKANTLDYLEASSVTTFKYQLNLFKEYSEEVLEAKAKASKAKASKAKASKAKAKASKNHIIIKYSYNRHIKDMRRRSFKASSEASSSEASSSEASSSEASSFKIKNKNIASFILNNKEVFTSEAIKKAKAILNS